MKITFLTLFPNLYQSFATDSILKRAVDENYFSFDVIDFRPFSKDKHKKVDDYPYGGGSGMILSCQPIVDAIKKYKTKDTKVILTSASGKKFSQKDCFDLSKEKNLIIIAGHYEGIDERILNFVDYEFSIGDYILTGGELPSQIIAEAIIRVIPGIIKEESIIEESFTTNLLEYPQYTRPQEIYNLSVPTILLNGDHKKINEFRKKQALLKTKKNRPDLLNLNEGKETENGN